MTSKKLSKKERWSRSVGNKALSVWIGHRFFALPSLGWLHAYAGGRAVLRDDPGPWHRKVCGLYVNTPIVSIFFQWRHFYKSQS